MPKIWKVKAGLPSWKILTLLSGNIFMCPHLSVSAMIAQLNGLTTSEMVSHTFFVFDLICQKNRCFNSWLLPKLALFWKQKMLLCSLHRWFWCSLIRIFTLGSNCPIRSKCLRISNFPIKSLYIPSTNFRWCGSGSGKSGFTRIQHWRTLQTYHWPK